MKCPYCAEEIQDAAIKCKHCGEMVDGSRPAPSIGKKLVRSKNDRMISGVCGGLAEHVKMDPTVIRLLTVLIGLFSGIVPVLIAYIVMACVLPEE